MRGRVRAFVVGLAFSVQAMLPAVCHAGPGADNPDLGRWASLLKRFEDPLHSAAPVSSNVMAWKAAIHHLQGLPAREQIEKVNALLNAVPYVDDQKQYGYNGYWAATPERFLSEGGDCKDYALAKYASLRALGFSSARLRITFVFDEVHNVPHAILVVDNAYVLDNQSPEIESVSNINQYQPLFSFNSNGWRKIG